MWNPFRSFGDYFGRWRPQFMNQLVYVLDRVPAPVMPMLPAPLSPAPPLPPLPPLPALPAPLQRSPQPPPHPAPVKAGADVIDNIQEHYFRETILDDLDRSFLYMRRLKRFDPDSYEYFRRVGIGIVPRTAMGDYCKLSPWFLQTRPSRGGLFFTQEKSHVGDKMFPRFVYFTKYNPRNAPAVFQRRNRGDIYEVTVVFDEHGDELCKFGGLGQSYAMWVDGDGTIVMLREHCSRKKQIRAKRRTTDRRRGEVFSIPQRRWGISPFMAEWAGDGCLSAEVRNKPELLALSLFTWCANAHEAAHAGIIRVNASRDGITVPFSVNIKRTPYFFKDRTTVVTAKGRTARIFHIVRPHVRANGSAVHMHFRGLRKFAWNGYDIHITVPGLHHEHIGEVDVSTSSEDSFKLGEPAISSAEFAKALARNIDGMPLRQSIDRAKREEMRPS